MRAARRVNHLIALVLGVALLAGVSPSRTLAAATAFTGGAHVGDAIKYTPNDHTPLGFRFNATAGLAPDTTYNLKVRFTVGTTPSPGTNRGFTYDPATNRWIQEASSWAEFPVVQTDSSGNIPYTWVYAKFGDERLSGTYRLMVSLHPTAGGSTYNSNILPVVSVIDMKTAGVWVHNGIATGATAAKRAELTSATASSEVFALRKTEADQVDGDADGVVDNEDYGPAGTAGDFRFTAPINTLCDVRLNQSAWVPGDDIDTGSVADVDLAIGGAELIPPARVTGLTITPGSNSAQLTWDTAADNTAVVAYHVYRWQLQAPSPYFTPVKHLIASVDTTGYADDAVENGVEYSYEVRAADAAGNVGPRSTEKTNVPQGERATGRLEGADRVETALRVSQSGWQDSSVTTAVVATAMNFPDALAASGLAGALDSPMILVRGSVSTAVIDELERLGASDVIVVGGTGAVSDKGAASIQAAGFSVTRLAGTDRYDTARLIAEKMLALGATPDSAFFVRGDTFADAVSVSPLAASAALPVLLIKPGTVPAATQAGISALGISEGVLAGGPGAVSDATLFTLDSMLSGTVTRVWGTDRYRTAAAVAAHGVAQGWSTPAYIGLATGTDYPDALAGGALAGHFGGVLLLTQPASLSPAAAQFIGDHRLLIDLVDVYGGPGAVHPQVMNEVEELLADG